MPNFWLVALPATGARHTKEAVWESLQESTAQARLSSNFKLEIPELRVGTLDTLMALSDDLAKTNSMIEAVVNKIKRQVNETGAAAAVASLKVEGLPADTYLTRFKWDEARFPSRRPLKETMDKIIEIIARIEDDQKVKVSEYNTLKGQLNAAARKQTGSLAVRDISTMVRAQDVLDTDNMGTLFVVVSKFSVQEWEQTYEKLVNYVVPRSSKVIAEDNDYCLVKVVMFKRVVDEFKAAARAKGYQVREYSAPAEGSELSEAQVEALRREVDSKKGSLEAWCKTAYGEALSAWIHTATIRLFVEAVLRYGLPPTFQAAVLRPAEKQDANLRKVLAERFGDGKGQIWRDDSSTVGVGLAGDTEMFPYVSLTLNVGDVV